MTDEQRTDVSDDVVVFVLLLIIQCPSPTSKNNELLSFLFSLSLVLARELASPDYFTYLSSIPTLL